MKQVFIFILLLKTSALFAQLKQFDIVTTSMPTGWKLSSQTQNVMQFSKTEGTNWAQINIYKSNVSKGTNELDFEKEWTELIANPFKVTDKPIKSKSEKFIKEWQKISGTANWTFNGSAVTTTVTTFTNRNTCISITCNATKPKYLEEYKQWLKKIQFIPNNEVETNLPATSKYETNSNNANNFQFNKTNFDDGWTSVIKEDWVETSKGNIKVLLHFPNKQADTYNSVLKESDYMAWNILVAPKYKNLQNIVWKTIQSWQSISFMEADGTEISSGKNVHIVLFKKHYSNGTGRYLEFITNSKSEYEKEFGSYHNDELGWEKPANMQYRNKFPIATNDLMGSWSTTDYTSISYYYINGGGLAGTNATTTADKFTFSSDNNYQSQHSGASGMVGNMKFSNVVYKGKTSVSNWTISLTNRFEGATEKYNAYFEAVKNGRALILTDRLNTTYTLVKQISK